MAGKLPGANAAQGTFQRTLQVTNQVSIDIATGSGGVNVRPGNSSQVLVTGHVKVTNWFGGDVQQRVKKVVDNPPIHQNRNEISIGHITNSGFLQNVSISYDLIVPPQTYLRSYTGSGNQNIEGLRGQLEIETGSGDLKLSDIGGTIRAETGSGDIQIYRIKGNVRAETGSGDIELRGVRGPLKAAAGSGDIAAEGNPTSGWTVHTASGDIRLKLASEAAFDLDVHTDSGSISTSQPITAQDARGPKELRGKVHGGGVLVEVATASGDIEIQ
ncbi:MAG: DUF4097 family beta strand repeat protein [Deltaproteobacteria bacterium]|nr:DUF4097 family beta strand repeat protein [Deltaproteobacteria bacterium]